MAASLVAVVVLALGFVLNALPQLGQAELRIDRILISHMPQPGVAGAAAVGALLEPVGGALLLLLGAVIIWRWTDVRRAARFVAVATVSWLSVEPVKLLVHRPRPVLPGVASAHESWSYPSGHVALAVALVAGAVAASRSYRVRALILVIGSVLVTTVAVTRLTLGAHYPSDVVAALFWSSSVAIVIDALLPAAAFAVARAGRHRSNAVLDERRRSEAPR